MVRNAKIVREDYLRFVKTKPCLGCGKKPVDADHLRAKGWRQAKRNDFTALPLCRPCHGLRHQWGDAKFQERKGLNLWREAFWLLLEFYHSERLASAQSMAEEMFGGNA